MSITTTALCWRSLRCEGMGCSHCCRTAAGGPIGQRLGPAEMPDRSRCEARASPRRWKYNRSAGSPASAPPDHAPKPTVVISSPLERSEEHTSELQSRLHLVCRLLLEKKKNTSTNQYRSTALNEHHPRSQYQLKCLCRPSGHCS